MIKVLATDLDGTLFYPKKPISLVNKKNKKLIVDFVSSGGRVVLTSSRSDQFLNKVRERLGVPVDYIGTDGTVINIDGKVVYERLFEPTIARKLIQEIRDAYDPGLILMASRDRPNVMTRTKVNHLTNVLYFLYEAVQGAYREPYVRSDHVFYSELAKGNVRKLMVLIGLSKKKQMEAEQITKKLAEEYPDFEFMWLNQFIEITPKGCSKASGVSFYLDYLGVNHDNTLVVGDSGNDVPMFEAFYENSYCMAHAKPSVRAKAKHAISRVSDLCPLLCPSVDSNPSEKEG